MGVDKWQLKINEITWLEQGRRQLSPLAEKVYISSTKIFKVDNCQEEDFICDLYPGEGPLGAWLSFAKKHPTRDLLSLPVDMPYVTTKDLSLLLGNQSCYLAGDNERAPLAAYLECKHFEKMIQFFTKGQRSVTAFWETIPHQKVILTEDKVLKNLNSPEDLANISDNPL